MKSLKRSISVLTAVSVLLSTLLIGMLSISAADNVWDGTVSNGFAGGTGTASDPYLISTPSQLAYFTQSSEYGAGGKVFKLTNDIYMNEVSGDTFTKTNEWNPNGEWFNGRFDGDGYTIYGLYISAAAAKDKGARGFIPYISGGKIENLRISHSEINADWQAGAFAGAANEWNFTGGDTVIEHCFADETVTVKSGAAAAGIIGQTGSEKAVPGIRVTNCGFTGSVTSHHPQGNTADEKPGGIIGSDGGTQITNCYSAAAISVFETSAKSGYINVYSHNENEADGRKLTADQMKGEAAKENMEGFDFTGIWQTVENGYPVLRAPQSVINPEPDPSGVWNGSIADGFAGGSGTAADPYLISTPSQLAYFASGGNKEKYGTAGTYFKLTDDIYLNEVTGDTFIQTNEWNPNSDWFKGVFNGDGHTIYGLYISAGAAKDKGARGFIPAISGGRIENLRISHSEINGDWQAGVFAGVAQEFTWSGAETVIDRCFADETTVVKSGASAAGITAQTSSEKDVPTIRITNCGFIGNAISQHPGGDKAAEKPGGIIGSDGGAQVTNCYSASAKSVFTTSAKSTYTNVYSHNENEADGRKLTAEQMKGENAVTNMRGFDFEGVWSAAEGTYPQLRVFMTEDFGEDPDYVWSGEIADGYAGGTGTETDPYLISTPEQLAYFASSYDSNNSDQKYYKLTSDIYLNSINGNKFKKKNVWINNQNPFSGYFDGNGHIIYGLYVPSAQIAAFIPVIQYKYARIERLGISHSELNASGDCGAVVGNISEFWWDWANVVIDRCFADNTVSVSGNTAGGLIGTIGFSSQQYPTVTLSNSYFAGSVNGRERTGGLIGWEFAPKIIVKDCYSATANNNRAMGEYNWESFNHQNVYTNSPEEYNGITSLTNEQMKGEAAKDNMSFDFDGTWWVKDSKTPELRLFLQLKDIMSDGIDIWDGTIPSEFSDTESAGTQADPIEIYTPGDLALLAAKTAEETLNKYYTLKNSIYLNNIFDNGWQSNEPNEWVTKKIQNDFKGTLDGNGYAVYGLYQSGGEKGGLFARLSGSIENIGFSKCSITADSAGLAAAESTGNAAVSAVYCANDCTVSNGAAGGNAAGIIGKAETGTVEISDCCYYGNASVAFVAGKAAIASVKIVRCVAAAVNNSDVIGFTTDSRTDVNNSYSIYTSENNGVTVLSSDDIKGEKAITALNKLYFKANENGCAEWSAVKDAFPTLKVFKDKIGSPAPDYVWNGTVSDGFSKGRGSKNNPYIISTAEELAYLVETANKEKTKGKYYRIDNDIYLNGIESDNWYMWANTWTSADNEAVFAGELDGGNHIIYGISVPLKANAEYAGLFAGLAGGSIKNLGVSYAVIGANKAAGAFAGIAADGTKEVRFENCFADTKVLVRSESAGGVIGGNNKTPVSFKNCYYTGALESVMYSGALIGNADTENGAYVNAEGCYAATEELSVLGSGGFSRLVLSPDDKNYIKNCYATRTQAEHDYSTEAAGMLETVNLRKMQGDRATKYMRGLDYSGAYTITDGTPALKGFAYRNSFTRVFAPALEVWDGTVAKGFDGGTGTASNPFRISNGAQLALMVANNDKFAGKCFIITNDIYLNDYKKQNWTDGANNWADVVNAATNGYHGTLNGCGNTIFGLYSYNEKQYGPGSLLPQLGRTSLIENLAFSHCELTSTQDTAGLIAGFIDFAANEQIMPIINRCFGDTTTKVTSKSYAGGFVGATGNSVYIKNSGFIGEVHGSSTGTGAFIGAKWNPQIFSAYKSFSATANNDPVVGGNSGLTLDFSSCYSTATNGSINRLYLLRMQGDAAKENMNSFDFNNIWETAEGTPVLRLFENTAESTRIYIPEKFTMTFNTNGGNTIDSISALPYTKLKLPTAKRGSDIFVGWYVDEELTVEFPINYMPEFSLTLYAKYISVSVTQDFEDYNVLLDSDLGIMSPALAEYDLKYVHGGLRSLMRKGEESDDEIVYVFNEDTVFENTGKPLEKGKKYNLTAWVYIDKTNNPDGKIKLIHCLDYETPDFDLTQYEIASLGSITKGSWQQISVVFTADSGYVGISLPGNTVMYLDDITITPTDKAAAKGIKNTGYSPENNYTDEPDSNSVAADDSNKNSAQKGGYWIKKTYKTVGGISVAAVTAISVSAALLVIAAVFALILVIRKKKRKAVEKQL